MPDFPFEAVIFDLDGTLADTLGDLADSMNWALAKHRQPTHEEARYRYLVGEGVENLARRALAAGRQDLLAALLEDFRARYAEHFADRTRVYPGIGELLSRLAERGCKLAVLSNKRDEFTRALVGTLLPDARFGVVRGERAGVPRKPDPAAALAIAEELKVAADRCAFVGDTAIDMTTATRAGMFAVGVLWGFRTRDELLAHGARVLLSHPSELLTVAIER